jgi:hypothetical protein
MKERPLHERDILIKNDPPCFWRDNPASLRRQILINGFGDQVPEDFFDIKRADHTFPVEAV